MATLVGLRLLEHVLLLAATAAARPAAGAAGRLGRLCVLIGLALVRCVGIGLVAGRLVGGAGAAARRLARDLLGHVGVERLLRCLGVPVGVLLRLADLDDVLLLTIPAATRPALAVATALRGVRVLIGLAAVRRIRVRLVADVLRRRARTNARISADDEQRYVRVHDVLLRSRVRVGVLLRLADLDHVLLLAVPATAGEARAVATRLRCGRVLIGLAVVRRISVGLVAGRLIRRARARAAQLVTQDRHRRIRIDGVLLRLCVCVGVLLRLPDLDYV